MIIKEMVSRIRYPDETDIICFDTLDYNDVVEGLKIALKSAKGHLKTDLQDTLDELEQIWEERQLKIRKFEIPARKTIKTV